MTGRPDDGGSAGPPLRPTSRKRNIRAAADAIAPHWDSWIAGRGFVHAEDERFLRFLIPGGARVLDLGCGTGAQLAALAPTRGVGVDFSEAMILEARRRHPDLEFHVGDIEDPSVLARLAGPFDVILLSDTVESLEDVQALFEQLHSLCGPATRVVLASTSALWSPVLRASRGSAGVAQPEPNWLSSRHLGGILDLADFDVVREDSRQLLPVRALGLGPWVNRFVGTLPGVRRGAIRTYLVARSRRAEPARGPSATVVIPCRNEAGNIAPAVDRMPDFCEDLEIIFVEGHSQDHTVSEIQALIEREPARDIKLLHQGGVGKADAVRTGFDAARGDVLMILDADLTMPPEDLPKFYEAIVSGRGELVMGTRLVYPMEDDAMRTLNILGNKLFSLAFTWLLNQRITDTLCGTKVLSRADYDEIKRGRAYFGDFDPFGDFDLIFGAAKLNLKILEIPVRYRARTYGTTQISRFRHGLLLARMVLVAYRKLKAV